MHRFKVTEGEREMNLEAYHSTFVKTKLSAEIDVQGLPFFPARQIGGIAPSLAPSVLRDNDCLTLEVEYGDRGELKYMPSNANAFWMTGRF